jgi:hypothetical protein
MGRTVSDGRRVCGDCRHALVRQTFDCQKFLVSRQAQRHPNNYSGQHKKQKNFD